MTVQVPNALEISDFIKENDPSIPVIWGGVHPFLFQESTVRDESVDIVVVGEGEHTMLELVKYFEDGTSLNDIDGIAYMNTDKEFIQTKPRKFMNMDELKSIKWDLLPKVTLRSQIRNGTLFIHTSRGCPHRCTFCINVAQRNLYRVRSAEKVLHDLEGIEEMGIKEFRIRDECFFVNAKRVEKIMDGIIERGMNFNWRTTIRADYFKPNHINNRIMKKVKKAGCTYLQFGAESGSERILEMLKKDITVKELLNSARICNKFKIIPYYSFMIGLPTETKEDVLKTIKLIDDIKRLCPKAGITGIQVYRPHPGGELYEQALRLGWDEPKTLRGWTKRVGRESVFNTAWDLPWVENPDYVETVSYSPLWAKGFKELSKGKSLTLKTLTAVFLLISMARWKTKIFQFPVDTRIRNFLNKYKHSL